MVRLLEEKAEWKVSRKPLVGDSTTYVHTDSLTTNAFRHLEEKLRPLQLINTHIHRVYM